MPAPAFSWGSGAIITAWKYPDAQWRPGIDLVAPGDPTNRVTANDAATVHGQTLLNFRP
jgi:hypothetical protein